MNERLDEIVFMFSDIAQLSKKEAKSVILKTETGKLIKENNFTVLYEQQPANIFSVVEDLKLLRLHKELVPLFTHEKIFLSMQKLMQHEATDMKKRFLSIKPIQSKPALKEKYAEYLQKRSKDMLQVKNKNILKGLEVLNAHKFKGQ